MAPKAVHFGPGNIGRGFVAEFLHQSGYEVVFVHYRENLVKQLNEQKSYKVIQMGVEGQSEHSITNYRALCSTTQADAVADEIATADVVTCSVGASNLKTLAGVIAKGIEKRSTDLQPLAVIPCENMIGSADFLIEQVKLPENTPADRLDDFNSRARFANSAIDRIVPAQDPNAGLDVYLETYHEWVVERTPFADHSVPAIKGIKWVDNLKPYIQRKLFTVNAAHAATAYYGYFYGHQTIHDALQDPQVLSGVSRVLEETSALIVSKHGFSAEEQREYAQNIIKRISNPYLNDSVERVGRAPLRKLGQMERFIAPAIELVLAGLPCAALLAAAEMAFRFQNVPGDEESKKLADLMKSGNSAAVVQQVCGISKDHPLFTQLEKKVAAVQCQSC